MAQAASVTAAGLCIAAVCFTGRYLFSRAPSIAQKFNKVLKSVDVNFTSSKYYRGGFEPKMSRREASLILGISHSATKPSIKESYKRLMTKNHPDKGGSPYIASKINAAKDYLEKIG